MALDEMLATIPLDKNLLEEKITNDFHLAEIARLLSDWRSVAPYLGFTEVEEEEILEENLRQDTRKLALLRKWRAKYGCTATYRNLAQCFYNAGKPEMLEMVCKVRCDQSSNMQQSQGYLRFETDVPILYTGKPQSLISKRDGLKIRIPESVLSLDVNKVQFKAFFSGWFQFPEGTELISGLYWIDCPVKQAKVEIQHCAAAKPADLPHVLTFVECTQEASLLSGQQNQFKVLDGGVFSSSSRYGSIDLSHSSIVAIVSKQNPTRPPRVDVGVNQPDSSKRYLARLYYRSIGMHNWEVYFAIMWNLDILINAVDGKFAEIDAKLVLECDVKFKQEQITLEIDEDGITVSGWKITPYTKLMITKQQVDGLAADGQAPFSQFGVKWTHQSETPMQLMYKVTLKGAVEPQWIRIQPPQSPRPFKLPQSSQVPQVMKLDGRNVLNVLHNAGVADGDWEQLGKQLVARSALRSIRANRLGNDVLSMIDTIYQWLRSDIEASWEKLVEAVETLRGGEATADMVRRKAGFAKKELNERNILSVLHEAEFADVHWEILGQQLIESSALMTIRANRPNDPHLCMIDIISRWLSTDPQASWEKLATAVGNVKTYGETTAAIVQQKATIVPLCETDPSTDLAAK